jgi:hypothetical protein
LKSTSSRPCRLSALLTLSRNGPIYMSFTQDCMVLWTLQHFWVNEIVCSTFTWLGGSEKPSKIGATVGVFISLYRVLWWENTKKHTKREREWEDSRELSGTSSHSWTALQRLNQTILIGFGTD